jgi:hypothetical protein
MSSRLSDLVAQVVAEHTSGGRIDTPAAERALLELLDEEAIERAKAEFVSRQIKAATTRHLAEFAAGNPAQGVLPLRLPAAFPVDLDGRRIVNTYDLTQAEACRALKVRRDQIKADTRAADNLERAIRMADPQWSRDPSLCLGQALELALAEPQPHAAA